MGIGGNNSTLSLHQPLFLYSSRESIVYIVSLSFCYLKSLAIPRWGRACWDAGPPPGQGEGRGGGGTQSRKGTITVS